VSTEGTSAYANRALHQKTDAKKWLTDNKKKILSDQMELGV
jgi:hypothetical protein